MARSLGLAAYRALARRGEVRHEAPKDPRPTGEVIWLHAGDPGNLLAVQDLAQRLIHSRSGLNALITLPDDHTITASTPAPMDAAIHQITGPSDHPAAVAQFLDHWQPDTAIWVWGNLQPNLILDTAARGCPLYLIDADEEGFDRRRMRWLKDLTRSTLGAFERIFARTEHAKRRLEQLGALPTRFDRTAALMAGGQALSCSELDLTELSAALGGRPTWLATNVLPNEINTVLAAHKQASRLSHRLLLILQPNGEEDARRAYDMATEQGLSTIRWDDGQHPDDTTQVMISADAAERGLFLRVAPVSFLGTTLIQGQGSCDPLQAAALGSAVLYGPKVRHFMPSYTRLAAAGAARIVNDADALGAAVSNLIAPDHAAAMAHAGWDVISEGAVLTDRVVDLMQDTLDARRSSL